MDPFSLFISLLVAYAGVFITIWILRGILWFLAGIFFLIDEIMWFAYNPFRLFMRNRHGNRNRYMFLGLNLFLLKPLYQFGVYLLTTPLRFVTALYFDLVLYLFVMTSDTLDELFHPKLGKMRSRSGLNYWFFWILFFPYRLAWLLVKNALAVVDSIMMMIVSTAWPTFTMYHGTKKEAATSISQKGKWLVGAGNYAGSGIYFGRSVKTAKHYATSFTNNEGTTVLPIVVVRVTLTMVRNCGTLKSEDKNLIGLGLGGRKLAERVKFPYFATELWRSGTNWWEYCLIQSGKEGSYISSWRIRPIGMVHVGKDEAFIARLERLWGGKGHYCLRPANIIMVGLSVVIVLFQLGLVSIVFEL